MILIIWMDGSESSENSKLPRLAGARIVRLNDESEVMETISIDCTAREDAGSDEILADWKSFFEKILGIPNEDSKLYYFFPRASQRNRFRYINNILFKRYDIAFTNETHEAVMGDLLVKDGERPGIEAGVPRLIELIQKQGLHGLTDSGHISKVLRQEQSAKRSSRRTGIFRCDSYHYYGDSESKVYHLRTCERLADVQDEKLTGLGKNPEKNGWKPCPVCIFVAAVHKKPTEKAANNNGSKKPLNMAWEKKAGSYHPVRTKAQVIQRDIADICNEYGMHAEFSGGTAFITTVAGEWFFTFNDRPIRLHHKNYADSAAKAARKTKLYHLQHDRFASSLHVLRYIGEHDLDLKRRVMQNMDGEIATDRYINGEAELDVLSKAMIFATKTHSSRAADGVSLPGVLHSAESALIASSLTSDTDVIVAAALHDVIDEGKAKTSDIKMVFGVRVLKYVESASDKSRPDLKEFKKFYDRKSRLIDYLFSKATAEERIIILSDVLSTMRFLNRELHNHGAISWEKYGGEDKKMQEWFYKGLRDSLGKMQDTDAWKELKDLIDQLFGKAMPEKTTEQIAKEQKTESNFTGFMRGLFKRFKMRDE